MENLPKETKQNKIKAEKTPNKESEVSVKEAPKFTDLQVKLMEAAKAHAANNQGVTVESILSSKLKFLKDRKHVLTMNKRESLLSNPDVLASDLDGIFDTRYNKEIEALSDLLK